MSAGYATSIRIGGPLKRSQLQTFIQAVSIRHVALEWGDVSFEPADGADLLTVLKNGHLWFCDEDAPYGEFEALEAACQELGLSYQRYCEASMGCDA